MSDPRTAAGLASWLLKRHWRASSLVVLAGVTVAALVARFVTFTDIRPWSLVTLATVGLTAGFVGWQSRGWSRWVRRLPMDPRWVWSAQMLWLVVLALPALLAVSWLRVDPGSSWAEWTRSFAWLFCLGAVLLASGSRGGRITAAGGLMLWLFLIETSLAILATGQAGAVVHDLALATVTVCYVLSGHGPARQTEVSGSLFLLPVFMLYGFHQPPGSMLISCAGMAVIGLAAFVRARPGRLGGFPALVSCALVLAGVTAIGAVVLWLLWKLLRAMIAWQGASTPADRLDQASAVGAEFLTPEWLTAGLILGWAVVLIVGEARRDRAVEGWLRQRALLERMPLTRGQVIARVLAPQLKIAATHGTLILVMGWGAGWAFRALELDGGARVWQRGPTILAVGLAYLLAAQVFVFRRGSDRWPRIAALVLTGIALTVSLILRDGPWVLTVAVSPLVVAAGWAAASRVPRPAPRRIASTKSAS